MLSAPPGCKTGQQLAHVLCCSCLGWMWHNTRSKSQMLPQGAFQLKQLEAEAFLTAPKRNKPQHSALTVELQLGSRLLAARDEPNSPEAPLAQLGALGPRAPQTPTAPVGPGIILSSHIPRAPLGPLMCSCIVPASLKSEMRNTLCGGRAEPSGAASSAMAAKAGWGTINPQLEQHKARHKNIPLTLALL